MSLLGELIGSLFVGNKNKYEKLSDFVDLENEVQPYVYFNSKSYYVSVIDIKEQVNRNFQIPFCLEFEKVFSTHFDDGLHMQFFKGKQGSTLKNYAVIYSLISEGKHKEICKSILDMIAKYKGEAAFVRNDHLKKYLKFFSDTSCKPEELKKEELLNQFFDKKKHDCYINYLKISNHYYSILSMAFETKFVPLEDICTELEGIDYHISMRMEKTLTPTTTIDNVVKVLSDQESELDVAPIASILQIKIWGKTQHELFDKINRVNRAFNYYGKTLFINNDDLYLDYMNTLPAIKQEMAGQIRIESINATVYNSNFIK